MNLGRGRQRVFHGESYYDAFFECLSQAHRRFGVEMRLDEAAQSALISAVQAIAAFALDQREQLVELDVNPLILDADGSVTAVDALLRMQT